jgi:hypothetical protein
MKWYRSRLVPMTAAVVREWLAEHPRVMNVAFLAGFYLTWLSLESDGWGDSTSYFGP